VNEIAIAVHDEDPSLLTAVRGSWPDETECPPEFDFLLVDCTVRTAADLASALLRCHCNLGDRPLVLGAVSVDEVASGKEGDPSWIAATAAGAGVGGTILSEFSPGRASPGRPATTAPAPPAATPSVGDLDVDWPSISVVISAHNAETTLDECLRHCDGLEYPDLEVIVVDDGSTDATPEIAGAHSHVKLVTIPPSGLSAARNAGYRSARGDLIAYLDADAYPAPEWPWYLALAALDDGVGGAGGPNVPPPDEPAPARIVARSPGGPVPQLLRPDRALHLPGCNMAFWRHVLEELNGFDRLLLQAGDDLEFEMRVVASGLQLAYHPAALVWHHRRPGIAPYLRQQFNYGRSLATLERRRPEGFPTGHRVRNAIRRLRAGPGARADACPVVYLTLPGPERPLLELAHQWGVPVAFVLVLSAPVALVNRKLAAPAMAASAFLVTLLAIDVGTAGRGRRRADRGLEVRATAAGFRVLRPLAFRWGHVRARWEQRSAGSVRPKPSRQ
jgi:hypothetical protein